MPDDGYDGPAELLAGELTVPVRVRLAGRFEPISGRYSWYGRLAADGRVRALVASNQRGIKLRTPAGTVDARLGDVDPWGRTRVEGWGRAPFSVMTRPPDEE